jgi:hypothetical protein
MTPILNHIPNNIVLVDVTPQMDAHRLLAVEQRVRNAPYLTQHHIRNRPCVAVLLQRPDVQPDRLLDDVILAVGDEEGPVGQVHNGRHDYHACEEGGVVEELAGEAD